MQEDPSEVEVDNLIVKENTKDDIDNIITVERIDEQTQFRVDMANDKSNTQ